MNKMLTTEEAENSSSVANLVRRLRFKFIPTDITAPIVVGAVLLMTDPVAAMKVLSEKFLEGGSPQLVEVVVDDRQKGMVIDDLGLVKGLTRNDRATAIFRAQYIERHPEADPERLPYIAGPAVILDQKCF